MYGILFDPGASCSMIGIDTMMGLRDDVVRKHGRDTEFLCHTSQRLSGIDSIANPSPGKFRIPLGLGPVEVLWDPVTLGGTGGRCPGLFGQDMCQRYNISVHWQ